MKQRKPSEIPGLRSKAELLLESTGGKAKEYEGIELLSLIHELQVHQVELEMQNQELRNSQKECETAWRNYHDLYENSPVGYLFLNEKGLILDMNLTAATMLGNVRSALIMSPLVRFLSPESVVIFTDFSRRVFSGTRFESCEVRLKDGSARPSWFLAEGVKTGKSVGQCSECRVVLCDISERKISENELIQLNMDLEAQVSERTHDLVKTIETLHMEIADRQRAEQELRQQEYILIQQNRLAAMGEMIGNIAHQWRQPLNTLGLITQRLSAFYGSSAFDKELLETSVAKSMEIIQYMSRTIDDFRNFFSSEQVKSEFRVEDAVRKALSLLEASFKDRRIRVELITEADVSITGYSNEYSQALLNILINAKDAINEREIESPRVTITIGQDAGMSVVTIADNAGGIPDTIIDKVFDPYFTTKGPQQGTGVGLFMAKSIIEKNMEGRLSVRNSAVGAEFQIEV